jgi:hypothetical protein
MVARRPAARKHALQGQGIPQTRVTPSGQVTGLSHDRAQVAGSAQRTRQWPPGQSTLQAPLHETSQSAAPSQCTRLPSPTLAAQLVLTCWHATVAPLPQVALQDCAFWHRAEAPSPPCKVHAPLPFAQSSAHWGPEHAWEHEAPAGHQQKAWPALHSIVDLPAELRHPAASAPTSPAARSAPARRATGQLLTGARLGDAGVAGPEAGALSSATGRRGVDQRALVGPSPVSSRRSFGCMPQERSLA